ncbi:MAG: DNA-binding protein [Pirellulaceae bacterium]|nr:DNA-binding protein [Pirellulaceae bacterium]
MTTSIVTAPASEENLVDAREIGRRFDLSYWTVLKWSRAGKIPCVHVSPRCLRYRVSEVASALGLRITESEAAE